MIGEAGTIPVDTDRDGMADALDGTKESFATTPLLDTDKDGIADIYDIDDDNDGITDLVELGDNPTRDTDGDGIIDSLDLDADNDGILDIVEANGTDADNDGKVDDATDTDNDGLADIADKNPNSADAPTSIEEATAVTVLPAVDTDGDGKSDFQDVDSDNDGIADAIEAGVPAENVDTNGMIKDPAVDENGIPTVVPSVATAVDTDNDGIADYRDLDSDNDGLTDVVESGGTDENQDGLDDTPNESLVDPTAIPTTDGVANPLIPNNPKLPAAIDPDKDGVIGEAGTIPVDTDRDGIADALDGNKESFATTALLDTDGDGIVDEYDLDDDNDGILDSVEDNGTPNRDTDGDGIVDSKDLDSDNDGILDIVEAGGEDTDNNGRVDDATDGDNDGLADIVDRMPTTANSVDDAMSTLPVTDTDRDSTPNFQDVDSDNDGIADAIEAGVPAENVDTDGMIKEATVDEDGIPTAVTAVAIPKDTDGDSVPDYRDLDADNDGILDVTEAGGTDANGDGVIDEEGTLLPTLPDSDGNGTPDVNEPNNSRLPAALDADGDGVIDDATDSDGDGVPDMLDGTKESFATEALEDTDADGIPDVYDLDDDNDGIPDLVEESGEEGRDTDGDGIVDTKDLDSDNDGILDVREAGGVDLDNNGRVDSAVDVDNDGLADVVDANPESADAPTDAEEARTITTLVVSDTDRDGRADFQDIDADNDGLSDLSESGTSADNDTDNDGMVDGDVDENGLTTTIVAVASPTDTDRDGTPDFQDSDSDNDGLFDVVEVEGVDEDKDGMIDDVDTLLDPTILPDEDGDDTPDYQEFDVVIFPDVLSNVELNTTGTVPVLANDQVDAIDISTLQITGTKNPGESLVVEGEGVWSIESDGSISFTPEADFVNDPADIAYSVEDKYGVRRPDVTVTVNYIANVREDVKVGNLNKPVTVNVLANDNGDLNVSTVKIVLPEGFMDKHPDAVLSADGKRLKVPTQGTWTVNPDGTITYIVEKGSRYVNPTPISYSVEDNNGNELSTSTLITLRKTVVAGVDDLSECQTSDSVPVFTKIGLGLLAMIGSIFGLFLFRKERNKI